MSRRPGIVERSILGVFGSDPDALLYSMEIAGRALGKRVLTEAEVSSYRRALRRLARRGTIADLGRGWRSGRRRYALPACAERYRERVRQTFGEEPRTGRPLQGVHPPASGYSAAASSPPSPSKK